MKQLTISMKDPIYIEDAASKKNSIDVLLKEGPDWNPRSLSTFSTFGGASLPVANGTINGHAEVGHHVTSVVVNGGIYPSTPPDVIPVIKHAHSKSLIGDTPSSALPRHAHSRSLLDGSAVSPFPSSFTDGDDSREISIFLGPGDRRFGFSVVGGIDEGFPPRIDEIAKSSPADKADLEVGDEILEVNGKSLEDATHTEVISHIHQCIRSRTICLRVKRRSGNKLAVDLAANSNVQDAFVIAVEQQARERLERLSALKKIKPVDMTKLSSQLEPSSTSVKPSPSAPPPTDDVNGVLDPIYVTDVPNLTPKERRTRSSTPRRSRKTTPSPRREAPALERRSPPPLTNGHTSRTEGDLDGNKSGDELELTHDLNDTLDDTEDLPRSEDSGESLPGTPEKNYGIVETNYHRPKEVLIDDSKSTLKASPSLDSSISRKSGGSSSGTGSGTPKHLPGSNGAPRHPSLPKDSAVDVSRYENMISMVEFDPTHREMAVDVPDTFVARTKTPPRYPPPRPHGSIQSSTPIYYNNSSKKGSSSSGSSTPQNGTLPKPVAAPKSPETAIAPKVSSQEVVVQGPHSQEELSRVKKYEEELRVRREREEEEAMLRSSLRSSQKLQALEKHSPPSGLVNQGFSHEEPNSSSDTPSKTFGINELIQSLQRIQTVLKSNGHRISEDMTLVAQLLTNPEFQKVLAVHNKVQETWCLNRPPTPVVENAKELVAECVQTLEKSSAPEATELITLLNKFSLEGLIFAHDQIAEREPLPVDPAEIAAEEIAEKMSSHYREEGVRIVRIDKTNEPLGATIRNEGDCVIIGRIVKGGAAEKSGLLHEGDEIIEVNGVEVRGKSVNDVCDMLSGMTGTLTFITVPNSSTSNWASVNKTIHVKAHFDYDPEEDLYIPCRELGLSFRKGDVLHVISQADPNWWQAYREGEEDQTLAGLVPSKSFQEQREAMRQTVVGDSNDKEKSKKGKLLCGKKQQKKKKKKMLYTNYSEDYETEEILTYEEVGLLYPRKHQKRPIVLIGPPNIGRHELRQKLMEDRDRFAAAVPHTSRAKRDGELDGQDYHFISRAQFEEDILSRKFVEHGEYEKAYYGTSLEAIRSVVNSGKICILNLHPLSLKILKNSDLKPFVVFIAPPTLEKLRQKKQKLGEPVKDEDLKEIIEKAREMEEQYGHYFDLIVINQDIEKTYQQILKEISNMEREPQWVPRPWLTNEH